MLSDQSRKMTIFEMEIEDDEDDTEMSQNSLLEISKESATSSNEWNETGITFLFILIYSFSLFFFI